MILKGRREQLGKDIAVTGIGYRIVLPKKNPTGVSVFDMLRLNPRYTFVIKFNDIYKRPAAGVSYIVKNDRTILAGVYTDKYYFELEGNTVGSFKIVKMLPNLIGIPIIKYKNDHERMGCFERVLPLLDALNVATSDRVNGVAQFIQAILWMNNCEIDTAQMHTPDFASLKNVIIGEGSHQKWCDPFSYYNRSPQSPHLKEK